MTKPTGRPVGRPKGSRNKVAKPVGRQVTLRLHADAEAALAWITLYADQRGLKRSDVIARAFENFLDKNTGNLPRPSERNPNWLEDHLAKNRAKLAESTHE